MVVSTVRGGGPRLTVGSTFFELWLVPLRPGRLLHHRAVAGHLMNIGLGRRVRHRGDGDRGRPAQFDVFRASLAFSPQGTQ